MRTMRYFVAMSLMFLGGAWHLEGQSGQAFSKAPMPQEVGVEGFRTGDQSKFNVDLDSILTATNEEFGLRLEHLTDLSLYTASLTPYRCEDVAKGRQVSYARVVGEMIDRSGVWKRDCRPDEFLLCDDDLGRCIFSTWCWNTVLDGLAPPSPSMVVSNTVEPVPVALTSTVPTTLSSDPVMDLIALAESEEEGVLIPPILITASPRRTTWWKQKRYWIPTTAALVLGGAYCARKGCFTIRNEFRPVNNTDIYTRRR